MKQINRVQIKDSHPLSIGATPVQVLIDGVAQLESAKSFRKSDALQKPPKTPSFKAAAQEALDFEGLPPLKQRRRNLWTLFKNVSAVYREDSDGVIYEDVLALNSSLKSVLVHKGEILCAGFCVAELEKADDTLETIDLDGGELVPGFTTFGTLVGLAEIRMEQFTADGVAFDPLFQNLKGMVGRERMIVRASDGLQFGGRDAL